MADVITQPYPYLDEHGQYIGPVTLRFADDEDRRWPCACHSKPTTLVLIGRMDATGRWPVVYVPLKDQSRAQWTADLINAFDTLDFVCQGGNTETGDFYHRLSR